MSDSKVNIQQQYQFFTTSTTTLAIMSTEYSNVCRNVDLLLNGAHH